MMLLVVDVGNTHTVVGLYKDDRLIDDWRIHTEPKLTVDEFQLMVSHFLERGGIEAAGIDQTVVSCVLK
ncbi:MAG: type III pantothenate kinase [Thermodesulfobacteriota bacterium]